MKYVIMGSGGTGGCIGAYLAMAGCDVDFIARGKHLEAMQNKGLILERSQNRVDVIKNAGFYTAEDYPHKADVIFVCVKYYSLKEAIDFVKKASKEGTVVIPVLNVFGTGSEMQEQLPDLTVTDGCIYIYSFIKESGTIAMPNDIFRVYFGLRDGQDNKDIEALRAVEADLKRAGIEGYLSAEVKKDTFRKFTYISPVACGGLYCNSGAGDLVHNSEYRAILEGLMRELLLIGEKMGIHYEEDMVAFNISVMEGLKKDADTSMQRDIAAGKKSEIAGLLYRVIDMGEKYGVDCPTYKKVGEKFTYLK